MKHNNFYKGIMIMLIFSMLGCKKDLLESTPYAQSTSATFWRNSDDAIAASNALYSRLGNEDFFAHPEQIWDITSDDQYRAGDHSDDQLIEDFTYNGSSRGWEDEVWPNRYEQVSRANALIINVPGIEMDNTLKNRILGEAYFMRGLMYWQCYKIYGQVPIITEENVIANNYNVPKATVDEMKLRIESDFMQAAELLFPVNDATNYGRPSKGSAWGYLSKFYLYNDEFENSIEYGNKVISSPNYQLADNFGDNFDPSIVVNSETLFNIQYKAGWMGSENPFSIHYQPRSWGGWSFNEPIDDLVNEFEPNDPRLKISIAQVGDILDFGEDDGPRVVTADLSSTGNIFLKHWKLNSGGTQDANVDIPMLRTADIYLVVAEAKIRSSQNGDNEINAVRARAGLDPIAGADIQDLIHERRVELAGECERHLDLIRWDKAGIINLVSHYAIDRGQWKPARSFQRPKNYYFPLPQRQIDLSNGVLVQNPNY